MRKATDMVLYEIKKCGMKRSCEVTSNRSFTLGKLAFISWLRGCIFVSETLR